MRGLVINQSPVFFRLYEGESEIIDEYGKPSFTNDDSLRRMLYLASQRITKRWRTRCQSWDLVLSQLELMFAGRTAG